VRVQDATAALLLVGAGGLAREMLAAIRLQPSEWKTDRCSGRRLKQARRRLDGVPELGGSEVAGELRAKQRDKLTAHKAQRLTRALSSAHVGAAFRVSILPYVEVKGASVREWLTPDDGKMKTVE